MTSARYPLDLVENEIHRLRIQGELFRADAERMLSEIGDLSGACALDLCCGVGGITDCLSVAVGPAGEVVGFDVDPAKLAEARRWNPAANVRFVEGDAFAPDLAPESFDLVHSRFAIGIIPGGVKIFDQAVRLVRPGGSLFLQEGLAEPYLCEPPHPAFDRGRAVMISCFERLGADLRLPMKLPGLFAEAGLGEAVFRPCLHFAGNDHPIQDHLGLTLEALRASVLDLGLMSDGELGRTIAEARAHLSAPGTSSLGYTMVQAVGRKPADPRQD